MDVSSKLGPALGTNRRTVLKTAASFAGVWAIPQGQTQQADTGAVESKKGFSVSAGKSRKGDPLVLPGGETVTCKLSGADTGDQNAVFETIIAAGSGPPLHVHADQDEWWYVLAGEFTFEVGLERFHLKPGDSIFGPRGTPHGYRNFGATPGKMLTVFNPAGRMEDFYTAFAKVAGLPPIPLLRSFFSRFGMKIVGSAIRPGTS